MPKTTETTLEVDLRALEANYRYIAGQLDPDVRIMGVVKAFAYGSDSVAVAKKLEPLGVDYLAVAYLREGISLRENGVKTPILLLHPQLGEYEQITQYLLEPNLYSRRLLDDFLTEAETSGLSGYPVHIEINTGMNRVGFSPGSATEISTGLKNTGSVTVKSVFSHLAASEDKGNRAFGEKQIARFDKAANTFAKNLGYAPLRHILNTSGIFNFPEAQYDMVRTGIGLYGFGNQPEVSAHLTPVATLRTVISQIHEVKKGEHIGYNFGHTAGEDMRTATLPIGHADGISRAYGKGKGRVVINGKKAPVVGNVCMDMLMVDVSDIDCSEGDEVVIFGKGNHTEDFAWDAGTISYEVIAAVSRRVKRVIIE